MSTLELSVGFHEDQGIRFSMEDAHVIEPLMQVEGLNQTLSLFGVFDGHGYVPIYCEIDL